MVAHLSAVSRAGRRVWVGALLMLSALPFQPARFHSSCASSNEEADLGFLMPTSLRGRGASRSRLQVGTSRAVVIRRAGEKQMADFKVGDTIAGEVIKVEPNLVFIKVPDFPRNAFARLTLLEKYPASEYTVGEEFVGKVYRADDKLGLILTQLDEPDLSRLDRPERIEAKFDFAEIRKMVNEEMEGSVAGIQKFGIFIDIGVRGGHDALAPTPMLKQIGKTSQDFTLGQKVQCWVCGTQEAGAAGSRNKILVSLAAPPEGGFPKPDWEP